jgi:hypothetical protein
VLGRSGFDSERLFRESGFARFSEAAVAALSAGSVEPLREAMGAAPGAAILERVAFAASVQGVAPLLSTVADVALLPPELGEFLAFERDSSAAREEKLLERLEETYRAFNAEGIEAVALKGALLLIRGETEPGLRPMGDLDLLLVTPERMEKATRTLLSLGWRVRFDTQRHRVFVRPDERVARPTCEDPENPIRIELHRHFRLPVLGRTYDATPSLVAAAETVARGGTCFLLASGAALGRHFLYHAAEDFAAAGLRGVQAYDFRLLSRRGAPFKMVLSESDRRAGLAPLAYAADAIEQLFPGSFNTAFLDLLRREAPDALLSRARALPSLRHTRPPHGWTRRALALAESPGRKARLLLRTAFPPLEEVKINAAPEASGPALGAAWVRLFVRRAGRLFTR